MKISFKVTGTTCHACKSMIEDIATDFSQIQHCEVDFKTGLGTLEYEDGFDIDTFKFAVDSVGQYELSFLLD